MVEGEEELERWWVLVERDVVEVARFLPAEMPRYFEASLMELLESPFCKEQLISKIFPF